MKCMSCGADIPPVWVAALNSNKCPGCNGPIMNEASQELLKELADALQRMPNDPQGVAGWLLSNYRFQKMGDGKPVEKFHRKGGGEARDDFDETELKVAPSYNEFVKRNDASHLVARSNELAAKFKGEKSGKIGELAALIQGVGDPYGDNTVNAKDEEPVSEEDQKSYLEMKRAGYDPFGQSAAPILPGAMSDLSQAINPGDVVKLLQSQSEDVPLENELMLSQTAKGRAILQMNQFKRIKAQEAVSGGGGGVFRRG